MILIVCIILGFIFIDLFCVCWVVCVCIICVFIVFLWWCWVILCVVGWIDVVIGDVNWFNNWVICGVLIFCECLVLSLIFCLIDDFLELFMLFIVGVNFLVCVGVVLLFFIVFVLVVVIGVVRFVFLVVLIVFES